MTSEKHSEIRRDIERARDDLATKTSELSHRAANAANNLRLSHQVEERPFAMLALSVVAGFAVERLLFGGGSKVIVMHHDEEEPQPRRKRKLKKRLRKMVARGAEHALGEESGGLSPMRAVMAAGQMAAGALAREVTARLLHRDAEPAAEPPNPTAYPS